MCLTVAHVPTSQSAARVVECSKSIYWFNGHFTRVRDKRVSKTGWLFPSHPSSRTKLFEDDIVKGGFIHAYTSTSSCGSHAYAFGVVAYGDDGDLVCRGMFIPACTDDDQLLNKTVKTIKVILESGKPDLRQVAKLHPNLAKLAKAKLL